MTELLPTSPSIQVSLIKTDGKTTTLEGPRVTLPKNCDCTSLDHKASVSYSMEASVEEENKDDNGEKERPSSTRLAEGGTNGDQNEK